MTVDYFYNLYNLYNKQRNKDTSGAPPPKKKTKTKQQNMRPTCLKGHLSINDFTLTYSQNESFLHITSPIME